MPIECCDAYTKRERLPDVKSSWSVVKYRTKQKLLLVFGDKQSTSPVEFKIACGVIGLNSLISREFIRRLGNHMRITVNNTFANLILSVSM